MGKALSPQAIALCDAYNLNTDPDDPWADVHIAPKYKIITRQGIEKIEAKSGIKTLALECLFIDPYEVVFKGTFALNDNIVVTTASASIDRIQPAYVSSKAMPNGLKAMVKTLLQENTPEALEKLKILSSMVFSEESSGNIVVGADKSGSPVYGSIILKKGNVQQSPPYLAEMAEKRVKSRGVLKLAGFYELGFYSQDEADDFQAVVDSKKNKNQSAKVEA